MSVYRFTLRFDLEDEREKKAAEALKGIKGGEKKRFVIDSILAKIENSIPLSSEALRKILREELGALYVFSAPTLAEASQICLSEDPEDEQSILDDLKLFG